MTLLGVIHPCGDSSHLAVVIQEGRKDRNVDVLDLVGYEEKFNVWLVDGTCELYIISFQRLTG